MILLKNCFLIATCNDKNEELKGYDILIKDNVIKKIEKEITLEGSDIVETEIINCDGCLVIPGLVNTHHHMYQTLTRNLKGAQNAKLFDWLIYLYPIWAKIDKEAIYYSTMLATAELLKTGTTLTTDHMYLYPEHINCDIMATQFEATQKTGIRFSPTRGCMTRGKSDGGLPPDNVVQKPDVVLQDMERVIKNFHDNSPLAMKKVILAPCSPFSVEKEVMVETAKLARQYNIYLHTHLAETQDENEYCVEIYKKRPLPLMEEWEWLGDDVFFAHGIWFNDEEMKVLQQTGTGVAHCPTSNMRLGSGIARVREMIDMNIPVGLAVDGSASNDSSDMLGEVRNALLLQRIKYGSNGLTAKEALKLGTKGGCALLNFKEKLGSIEIGKGADIAIFDMNQLQYAGSLSDPVASLIFTGYNHQVKHTIVNGNLVVENGKVKGVDEQFLTEKINNIAEKLLL
jgi:cytosine/adenosine deaminase-related metal-dependent hydrolase